MQADAERQTVIVVHGTFSGKVPDGEPGWYAPGQTFSRDLDRELEAACSPARCWRHLSPADDYFHWDGANEWLSRLKATARLRDELRRLHGLGWTVHLVGHSHGGNIVVDAITNNHGRVEPWFTGRVALLGTPLYRNSPRFFRRRWALVARWTVASALAWAALLYASARHVDVLAAFEPDAPTANWAIALVFVLAFAAVGLSLRALGPLASRFLWLQLVLLRLQPYRSPAPMGEERWSPSFLLINSRFDEAYRALAGLREGANPLIAGTAPPRRGFRSHFGAVLEAGRRRLATLIANALDTQRARALLVTGTACALVLLLWRIALVPLLPALSAHGASMGFWIVVALVVAAAFVFDRLLFLPGIVLVEGVSAVLRGIADLAVLSFNAPIRRSVWAFVRSFGLGLSGSPRPVEDIAVKLAFDPTDPEDCVYLELPADVVAGVVDAQKSRLSEIHELLYRPMATWTPNYLVDELAAIGMPLVHTIYYRNAECIAKIAGWLCEPRVKELDGRVRHKVTTLRTGLPGGLSQGFIEEIEGVNAYRKHLEDLKRRHGEGDPRWSAAPPGPAGPPSILRPQWGLGAPPPPRSKDS